MQDIALVVALISLVGVLMNAKVAADNARKRGELDRSLTELGAELGSVSARNLAEFQAEHAKGLAELEHAHARELKELEARLDQQLSAVRIREVINEENWRRIHLQIRALKDVGFDMAGAFKELASKGHELGDEQLFAEVWTTLKHHQRFKEVLRELRAEIGDEDHQRLDEFHRFLVVVFLDIGRTQAERLAKVEAMKKHLKRIAAGERHLEAIAAPFLKPDLPRQT